MKITYKKLPNTDAFYNVRVSTLGLAGSTYIGQVKKVYLSRSQTAWTIEPRDFIPRVTTRLTYGTRKAATDALIKYIINGCTQRSLVEG